ncbi:MAG TPA: tyrosinase family protein [Longimicrobiaceae bacterium]|jgi:tyrosinase
MKVDLQVNDSADPRARYLTWAPSPCRIRVSDPAGSTGPTVSVRLAGKSGAAAGAVVFRSGGTGPFSAGLTLQVPVNGASVPFFVAGKFGRPSVSDGDVAIEARVGSTVVGSVPVMVRVRKNANTLTAAERDRFVSAFAKLNNQGLGRFVDFRDMHTAQSHRQAHGLPAFLPWHRAYLLDLERELQAIDPGVALHYWRFDQPAPKVFAADFMGVSDNIGTVRFSNTNPLQFWTTDGVQGVNRRPLFATSAAPPGLRDEAGTLAIGSRYAVFRPEMEFDPHGLAHTSFGGAISSVPTAARDPLFFLLHSNVDRLWAKWQRGVGRFDPAVKASFDDNAASPAGHRLNDTMWPWNGVTGGTRPPTAPGGPLAASPATAAPGARPRVRDCLDYQGAVAAASRMGFDYDDVPFA